MNTQKTQAKKAAEAHRNGDLALITLLLGTPGLTEVEARRELGFPDRGRAVPRPRSENRETVSPKLEA